MMSDTKWLNWFEIPVNDFNRAKEFYETIFNINLLVEDFGGLKMGVFPHESLGGAICYGEWYKPSENGVVIYMDANPDLTDVQNRIEGAGGKIIQAKKQISPDHGYMALFLDTEGNRLALHSMG
jgi:predicted enzyme related to lactoylglutathione lyase